MLLAESNDILSGGSSAEDNNYPTGCAFSPDGTCVLTATCSDGVIRLYDTPFGYLAPSSNPGSDDDAAAGRNENAKRVDDPNQGTEEGGFSHNQNYHPPPRRAASSSWTASLTSHLGGDPPPSSFASHAWYPLMNSADPITSFYASCRGPSSPIHLIDAYTSRLRASYRPHNAADQMEGPTVVAFRPDGAKLYGTGFKTDRTIAVFDTAVPGRTGSIARLGRTRRSRDGQKGMPSSIAFPSTTTAFSPNVFAVGTYSPASIYVYDDRMQAADSSTSAAGTIVLHGGWAVVGHGRAFSRKKRRFADAAVIAATGSSSSGSRRRGNGGAVGGDHPNTVVDDDDETTNDNVNLFSSARVNWFQSRARGGVTQLTWAPPSGSVGASNNPYVLYSASRRSNVVLSWDVRALSGKREDDAKGRPPICGLRSYAREEDDGDAAAATNQRLQFDIDPAGQKLFVPSGRGAVKIYDVASGRLERTLRVENSRGGHAVNGVSYHPCSGTSIEDKFTGLLAIALGSRQFRDFSSDDDEDDDDDSDHIARSVQEKCPGSLRLYGIT